MAEHFGNNILDWEGSLDADHRRQLVYSLESGLLNMPIDYNNLSWPFTSPISILDRVDIADLSESSFRGALLNVARAQAFIGATFRAHGMSAKQ